MARIWTHVMLHHSLTADGKVVDTTAIKRYHTSWRYEGRIITPGEAQSLIVQGKHGVISPWKDIGYHYTIEHVGDDIKVMEGRSLEMDGAACPEGGMNRHGIQICMIGCYNYPDEKRELPGSGSPEDEKLIVLGKLLIRLHDEGRWVPPTAIGSEMLSFVVGHRDYAFHPYPPAVGQEPYKLCPGSAWDYRADLKRVESLYY